MHYSVFAIHAPFQFRFTTPQSRIASERQDMLYIVFKVFNHAPIYILDNRKLSVFNPGRLPSGLTIEELFTAHKSIPANPLLAESLYLYGTNERMGTGTGDIVNLCAEMDLKQPEFRQGTGFEVVLFRSPSLKHAFPQATPQATPQVTPQVLRLPKLAT